MARSARQAKSSWDTPETRQAWAEVVAEAQSLRERYPAGVEWKEIVNDDKRRAAWRKLKAVNQEGKHCLAEYAKDQKPLTTLGVAMATLEARMGNLRNEIEPLRQRSRLFANADEPIPPALAKKIDGLTQAWVDASHERLQLKAHDGQKRMNMIRPVAEDSVSPELAAQSRSCGHGRESGQGLRGRLLLRHRDVKRVAKFGKSESVAACTPQSKGWDTTRQRLHSQRGR